MLFCGPESDWAPLASGLRTTRGPGMEIVRVVQTGTLRLLGAQLALWCF